MLDDFMNTAYEMVANDWEAQKAIEQSKTELQIYESQLQEQQKQLGNQKNEISEKLLQD